jgi:hypothetical protein
LDGKEMKIMMKTMNKRWIALGLAGAIGLAPLAGVTTEAQASAKTKKYLMYGAGAVTGYGLLKHKYGLAAVGAGATYLAHKSYKKSKKKEEAQSQAWYRQRYGSAWRNHYKPGA